jgi:hypothetical protein
MLLLTALRIVFPSTGISLIRLLYGCVRLFMDFIYMKHITAALKFIILPYVLIYNDIYVFPRYFNRL